MTEQVYVKHMYPHVTEGKDAAEAEPHLPCEEIHLACKLPFCCSKFSVIENLCSNIK